MAAATPTPTNTNDDMLKLGANSACQKMLAKMGDNFPDMEKVVLSIKLIKINKRKKQQQRILLLTDKALYNLKPKEFKKCQRRIELEKIVSITESTTSDEFAIHIPEEYDYRYKSSSKGRIIRVLAELYKRKEGKNIAINRVTDASTEKYVVNKNVARLQTREQRLRRYRELIGKDSYQDELDDIKRGQIVTNVGNINSNNVKVKPSDFEFLKVIGRGSFGKVMQVRKKDDNTIYAMKILKKQSIIDKKQIGHTNAENKILRCLQHPFLMHLRFAFQTPSKLYFVLDYYRGGELFFHLKKKRRFTVPQAQLFVAEVGCALGHLHSLDVVYRDLKPENILLDHSGHVCLTDFGLSKELQNGDNTDTFCGTPEYLPPEIVMNLGHGKPVDWWSLGILLYELTVGIPPFYSQNVNEMYRKIQEAPLLFPPNLSQKCKNLITKLLIRDPSKRLGSGNADFKDIMKHVFFDNLDWVKLYNKEIDPPYKPNVKGNDHSVPNCFDDIFLNEPIKDTPANAPGPLPVNIKTTNNNNNVNNSNFGGFSFMPQNNNGALPIK